MATGAGIVELRPGKVLNKNQTLPSLCALPDASS